MLYNETVTLKDGTVCVLRNTTKEDAVTVRNLFTLTHNQTDYLRSFGGESPHSVEETAMFSERNMKSNRALQLLAEIDGKGVGLAGISPVGLTGKDQHRSEFGISIDQAYWGLGIGRKMTEVCIECAKRAGFVQMELEAVAENEKALNLYRSVGFTEFGRNPKGFLSEFTGYQEVVYMLLDLTK